MVKILDLGLVRSEADAGTLLTQQLDNKNILGNKVFEEINELTFSRSNNWR